MENVIEDIIKEMERLEKEEYDCVSYDFGNGKAIFIQVTDYGDGFEYLYEANDIVDGAYEPYSDWNASSAYGDMEEAKETLENFIDEWELMK